MSYVLGISAYYHDSSATLIRDGRICGAVQEERFSRIKHDSSFPALSIKFLLSNNNINLEDIDYIVFYENPNLKLDRIIKTFISCSPAGFLSFLALINLNFKKIFFLKNKIQEEIKKKFKLKKKIKIHFTKHHLSHAASAFFPSPFKESIILTLDGVGEWNTSTISIGKKNKIEMKETINFPDSLGLLYSAFTQYLGFKVNSGEYKVMGLAPYGEPKYFDLIINNIVNIKDDGSFKISLKYFDYLVGFKMINQNFEKLFKNKKRSSEKEPLLQFHMDVASSIQKVTEFIILRIIKYIKKKYNCENLCLAGGVALNCVANGKILESNLFKNIWIQPASGDAGGSLGAALNFWYNKLENKRIVNHEDDMCGSFLGPNFSNNEIKKELDELGANYEEMEEDSLLELICKEMNNHKAFGWFQGRMEFGPRSLGGRSIIADPRSDKMQKTLNLKIKFRESFRPFAPSILENKATEFFKIQTKSPYMLYVSGINDNLKNNLKESDKKLSGLDKLKIIRSTIPAVTHIDYSARLQTVNKKTNLKFYKLLEKFNDLYNCPLVINTSFNIRGEPIVCSPTDAFKCFMANGLDYLVIENFILKKENQNYKLMNSYWDKIKPD